MASKLNKRLIKELETEGKRLRAWVDEFAENLGEGDEILVADGLDAAIAGISEGMEPVVIYDWDKCIEIFRVRDGMSEEDALEYMSFNVTGAYVGKRTPIFCRFIP